MYIRVSDHVKSKQTKQKTSVCGMVVTVFGKKDKGGRKYSALVAVGDDADCCAKRVTLTDTATVSSAAVFMKLPDAVFASTTKQDELLVAFLEEESASFAQSQTVLSKGGKGRKRKAASSGEDDDDAEEEDASAHEEPPPAKRPRRTVAAPKNEYLDKRQEGQDAKKSRPKPKPAGKPPQRPMEVC